MSASMIRRGLDLLNNDVKGKERKQKTKRVQQAGRAGIMSQVDSKRQGVRKQVRRLQGHTGVRKSKATVKNKHIKSALEEYKNKQMKSQLRANLRYFLGAGYKTLANDTKKILLQNSGRQSRHKPDAPVKKPAEKKSVFTEEQFQQFQKEYFGTL